MLLPTKLSSRLYSFLDYNDLKQIAMKIWNYFMDGENIYCPDKADVNYLKVVQ